MLTRLTLTDFRNYAGLVWSPAARVAVISGPNGSGKTNLLEAISLLSPGRGLRGARLADLARRGGAGTWAVAARLDRAGMRIELGTGTSAETGVERRAFRLDGAAPRGQAEIAEVFAAVWLTPQMDRLFLEGPSGRRRFLDRLVLALEPGHARELAAHETAIASRNRLLAQGGADPAWLAGLEDSIARHATAATASRAGFVNRFNASERTPEGFPAPRLALLDPIAERLAAGPALDVEDWLRRSLAASRPTDAAAAATSLGAHRTDFAMFEAVSDLPAALASTGEQKAMLIGTVLRHAALVAETRGGAPMLLLDEPAVHLDVARRDALFRALEGIAAQTLITGTDEAVFHRLLPVASFWTAGGGMLLGAH